jgi:hypothetical protein
MALGIKSPGIYHISWNTSFVTSLIFDVYQTDADPLYFAQFFLIFLC